MRGLNERIALAQARIAAVIDPTSDEADVGNVAYEAQAMGVRDYQAGEMSAPVMFRDEPFLLTAWESGQDFAAELEEMSRCSGCQDPELPMCPFHG